MLAGRLKLAIPGPARLWYGAAIHGGWPVSRSAEILAALCGLFLLGSTAGAGGLDVAQVVRVERDGQCVPELAERVAQYLEANGQSSLTTPADNKRGCGCRNQPTCVRRLLQEQHARYGIDAELLEQGADYRLVVTLHDSQDRTSGHNREWLLKASEVLRELPIKVDSLLREFRSRSRNVEFSGATPQALPPALGRERRRSIIDGIGISFGILGLAGLAASVVLVAKHGEPVSATCDRMPAPRPCVLDTRSFYIAGFLASGLLSVGSALMLGVR